VERERGISYAGGEGRSRKDISLASADMDSRWREGSRAKMAFM